MYTPQRILVPVRPVNRQWDDPETQLIISPATANAIKQRESAERDMRARRKENKTGEEFKKLIDMKALPTKAGENLSDDDIIEEAMEQDEWRKRKGEKKIGKIDEAIIEARKHLGEGPNADKRFSVVVPERLVRSRRSAHQAGHSP